jgi:hypothetical protein
VYDALRSGRRIGSDTQAQRTQTRPNATPAPSQDDVDYALLLALGAVYGYGLGKAPFLLALGRKPNSQTDAAVMQRLVDMVQAVLAPAAIKH